MPVDDNAAQKRRLLLDAAIRVFAQRGFHGCRVSHIAQEAGVSYGLVYHYFSSKEEILNTIFLERWGLLLEVIVEVDATEISAVDKLASIAGFIIDSYRHNPDLMKVIIVEVTRAANTFGRTHLAEIRAAYEGISRIVARAQTDGSFRDDIAPEFAALAFYGTIEQVLTSWIFGLAEQDEAAFERAKSNVVAVICDGLHRRTRTA